jgi:hypothetical protein
MGAGNHATRARGGSRGKQQKGAIMKEKKRNQLEVRLRKMLDHLDQAKAKKKRSITQAGTGNIIRRRKGEKEKRFSIPT